jgi:hypothetical protein
MILITDNFVFINHSIDNDVLDGPTLSAEIAVIRNTKAGSHHIEELDIDILIDEDMLLTKAILNFKSPILEKD